MKIIGITGQTGAGKSTVCEKLEQYGYYHIDADKIARELTEKGSPVIPDLCAAFGDDIMNTDGCVNRKTLAKKAFSTPENTLLLNSVTHPAVTKKIKEIIDEHSADNIAGVLIDAIALFESGENKLCDFTVYITAPTEIRLKRIVERDNISVEEAMLRINAQNKDDFYRKKADYTIINENERMLDNEIKRIFQL